MQYTDAHKQLAKAIMNTHTAHQASYDTVMHEYLLSIHEAAEKAAPAEYFEPVTCLLTAGFCEIFDWCDNVLKS